MLKFEIFNQAPEPEKEPVRLALKQDSHGTVKLIAVDRNGDKVVGGNILGITPDGTVCRYLNVNPRLGFRPDSRGRIVVDE